MSSFQILTCCRAPHAMAARGLERAEPTPTRAPGRPKTSLTSLPSEGPHAVRACRESNPDLPIHSPARYLYATAAGPLTGLGNFLPAKKLPHKLGLILTCQPIFSLLVVYLLFWSFSRRRRWHRLLTSSSTALPLIALYTYVGRILNLGAIVSLG